MFMQLLLALVLTPLLSFVHGVDCPTEAGPPAGRWRLDPARSVAEFTVTKLGFADVTGHFTDLSGTVRYDASNPENSAVEWTINVASVKTDERRRDEALRAREYFDVERYPSMRFQSSRVRAIGGNRLEVEGEITIKGHVRPLTIIATPMDGGFETRFELNRYDFGVIGGTVMRNMIGRTVRVRLVAVAGQGER